MVCFCGKYASSAVPCAQLGAWGSSRCGSWRWQWQQQLLFCCLENHRVQAMVGWGLLQGFIQHLTVRWPVWLR